MTTYKELVYFVLDSIRAVSDDSFITKDHVLFLLNKYRSYLLKQKYEKDPRRQVPDSNYQTVELSLKQYGTLNEDWYYQDKPIPESTADPNEEKINFTELIEETADEHGNSFFDDYNLVKRTYLKSVEELPNTMQVGISSCYVVNPFKSTVTIVSKERLEFVGWNKFLQRIIYGAIGPDQHLYIKSNNKLFLAIKKVKFRAILEDPTSVMDDPMEENCPIEEALVAPLLKSVIADLLNFEYRPQDPENNANDDLSDIARFIRQNMKDKYAKEYLDGQGE